MEGREEHPSNYPPFDWYKCSICGYFMYMLTDESEDAMIRVCEHCDLIKWEDYIEAE